MNLPQEKRDELEQKIEWFCTQYGFDPSRDIVEELDRIGFKVVTAKISDNVDGMILVDETRESIAEYNSNKLIFVDERKDVFASRFIILHELSHYIESKYERMVHGDFGFPHVLVAERDHRVGYSSDAFEQEKDYMAAALLLPFLPFKRKVYEYIFAQKKYTSYNQITEKDILALKADKYFIFSIQLEYKVAEKLVIRRLTEINLTEKTVA